MTYAPLKSAPLWLLTLIIFSGTLAMHIFVPALPDAARDLGAGIGAMQLTMSVYIFGLAAGQLVYGPLSDRFGRRPVLMGGLAIYTITGVWALFVADVHTLIVVRLLQALGGCSGMVIGRAVVRDTAAGSEAARRLALMNMMVVLGPGLAPLLGSAITATFGWRAIFVVLAGMGAMNFLFAWRLLPETRPDIAVAGPSELGRNYRHLLASPVFLGYALGGGFATTSMYAFVAASPFIFTHQLGRPDWEVGFYLAALLSGTWLGTLATTRLITKVPLDRLALGAGAISFLSAAGLLAVVLSGHMTVLSIMAPMFFFAMMVGIASPAALTQAMGVNPKVAGSASGLFGFSQMSVGAVATALASLGSNPALSAAIVVTAAATIALLSFWIAARRRVPTELID
jgi:DHA1 family bicyclomycin/chloramphenicol resistance-like MFS transporter